MLYLPYIKDLTTNITVYGIAQLTSTLTTGTYTDIDDGLMAEYFVLEAVGRLVQAADIPRMTAQDITMGDQSVQILGRTKLGQNWAQLARAKRLALQAQLRLTLPVMPKWNRGHSPTGGGRIGVGFGGVI